MNTKRYSRLASVQQARDKQIAFKYIFLSIITTIIFIFFGLPLIVKFAGFIGEISKSGKNVEINDITPPAPPQLDDIPEYSRDEKIDINGKSEPGAIISITANKNTSEIVTSNDGSFSFVFNLDKGENTISAKAIDKSGNQSTQTKIYATYYDNEEPKLEISSPTDGSSYYGNNQKQISIHGSVSEIVNLTINNRIVSTKDDGSFTYVSTLNEGENKFEIKAIDRSGNETATSLTLNFSL